jgi:uncharacterized protein (DUF433 family)
MVSRMPRSTGHARGVSGPNERENTVIDSELHHRIVRDPECCGGEPTIRGTRVTLRVILASLAEGDRPEEIVAAFPSLCMDDVRAAITFAAARSDVEPPNRVRLEKAS